MERKNVELKLRGSVKCPVCKTAIDEFTERDVKVVHNEAGDIVSSYITCPVCESDIAMDTNVTEVMADYIQKLGEITAENASSCECSNCDDTCGDSNCTTSYDAIRDLLARADDYLTDLQDIAIDDEYADRILSRGEDIMTRMSNQLIKFADIIDMYIGEEYSDMEEE